MRYRVSQVDVLGSFISELHCTILTIDDFSRELFIHADLAAHTVTVL